MTCRDRSVSEHAGNLKGHRERLKERFLKQDARGLPDREMLELLLTYAVPRKDVGPLGEELLRRFGDLKEVLHASTLELTRIKGRKRAHRDAHPSCCGSRRAMPGTQ